jgi:hypothetical protein
MMSGPIEMNNNAINNVSALSTGPITLFGGSAGGKILLSYPNVTTTSTLYLPAGAGATGQTMISNGSNGLSWGTPDDTTKVPLAGGTMTGTLNFSSVVSAIKTNGGSISTGNGGSSIGGGGQIYGGAYSNSGNTIDFNNGNQQTTSFSCSGSINLNNMQSGGNYTVVMTDTTSTQCSFIGSSGESFLFNPANGLRTASKQTIYRFTKIGTTVYVDWKSGY